MSTAYHPQTDGQTERVNQVLEQYLRCFVDNYNHEDWVDFLPTAEFAYNNAAHESTKETPYFLEYGRHPRAGPTLVKQAKRTDLNEIFRLRQDAQDKAKAALQLAADRMKWYYDQYKQEVPFKVGDKVLLDSKDYQTTQRSLTPRYLGPFDIIEQLSQVTFKVKLPAKYRAIHPVFHASKLIPYSTPSIVGQKQAPPEPEEHDGHTEYVVEKILNHKTTGRVKVKHWYLVRWKGYGPEEDSWEPESNLEGVKDLIEKFRKEILYLAPGKLEIQHLDLEDTLQIVLEGGKPPHRGSTEAAGFDLYAAEDTVIPIGTRKPINSGIRIRVPAGTYGRIAPRSGLALKGIDVGAGVIDRDYTGVIKILLHNSSDRDFLVTTGDRIAQLILEKIANAAIEVVDDLAATERGTSGFGSTGK
ncbi:dUTPase domain-containing protein [Phanerochaete sordida]|uniref:dUTP diphosphatase n=1 Tax=Phanerochaete sordida TaxID=48140 RepID=A0A9P3LJR6_9APHY|nr:dUTPase domain-containing protein [Phanerochaete sordida]